MFDATFGPPGRERPGTGRENLESGRDFVYIMARAANGRASDPATPLGRSGCTGRGPSRSRLGRIGRPSGLSRTTAKADSDDWGETDIRANNVKSSAGTKRYIAAWQGA